LDAAADAPSETPVLVVQRLTLRQAIDTGLMQNPDLTALRQTEGVGTAALAVARTYPFNPYIQSTVTPYQNNQDPSVGPTSTTYHYVLIMQQFQLAGQQGFREAAGCASLNTVRWNVLQAELVNIATTERLYFLALYQKGIRDLAKLNADNNQEFLRILERQLEAGQATAADVAIVRMDARSTRQQYQLAEANYETALLDLRRQIGLEYDAPFELDDDIASWNWVAKDGEQLASQSVNRPDVMAARSDLDTARANAGLANASRTPDLQIGPYYQRGNDGTTYLGMRAHMEIPVINNGMPLLRQREAEYQQRAMAWNQLQIRAALEARAAVNRYERARRMLADVARNENQTLPVELERLESQYRDGEVDVLRVVQARNSMIQSRRADLDSMNEMYQAATALTAAAAVPIESLTSDTSDPIKLDSDK
jgi:cobalt-zinc-cadmium efflux system outer membrane protein